MKISIMFLPIILGYILLTCFFGTIDIRTAGPLFNTYLGVCITLIGIRLVTPLLEKEDKARKAEK